MKINKAFYAVLLVFSGVIVAVPGTPANPGFDLMNKSGKDITVAVVNGYDPKIVARAVIKQATTLFGKTITPKNLSVNIDTDQPTLLRVYEGAHSDFADNNSKKRIEAFPTMPCCEFTPKYFNNWMWVGPKTTTYTYHFAKGKDIYVTLDPNGNLRPQVGPGNGKTATGYSQVNEVTQSDIMQMEHQPEYD